MPFKETYTYLIASCHFEYQIAKSWAELRIQWFRRQRGKIQDESTHYKLAKNKNEKDLYLLTIVSLFIWERDTDRICTFALHWMRSLVHTLPLSLSCPHRCFLVCAYVWCRESMNAWWRVCREFIGISNCNIQVESWWVI